MSQKSLFAEPISPVSVSAPSLLTNRLAIAVVLVCICTPIDIFAQGQHSFSPAQNRVASYDSWNPPGSTPTATIKASFEQQPSQDFALNDGFPAATVAFDSGDRSARFGHEASDRNDSAIESTIDSTATMLSSLSNSVGAKTSGWLSSIQQDGGWTATIRSLFGSTEIGKMLGSLALVLGLYFAFVWVMRKINPSGNRGLPAEVVSVIGQVPFGPRRNLQLVRLGNKLLLLMNSPEGTQPIGEITDASEVEYLTSLCPGKSQTSGNIGAIHRAANRPTEPVRQTTAGPEPTHSNTNLTQVIRMLENAAKSGGAVFDA